MLHSKKTLKLFESLGRVRPVQEFGLGARVGRGFADVGFEEFILLPGNRLSSLLTGNISSLDEIRREHLFEILNADQLIAEIHEQGYEIERLHCRDLRIWEGTVKKLSDTCIYSCESSSLEDVLLSLLLSIFHVAQSEDVRCLKTIMVNE